MVAIAATCPPHHWLVEEQPTGLQRWACYRCGEERELQPVPQERPCVSWAPRQGAQQPNPID